MFEAKLQDVSILKRIVDSIKDLVNEVNLDIGSSGKLFSLSFRHLSSSYGQFSRCSCFTELEHGRL